MLKTIDDLRFARRMAWRGITTPRYNGDGEYLGPDPADQARYHELCERLREHDTQLVALFTAGQLTALQLADKF